MSNAPPRRRPKRRRDPVLKALRRLIAATDQSIAATDEVRRARVELAKVVENTDNNTEGRDDD